LKKETEQSWGGSLEKRERHLKEERGRIEDDMLTMAKSMKEQANGFT
jgi:hypothetical protein